MSLDLKVSSMDSDVCCTLSELHATIGKGKHMVIDLWHTKCVKCPAALSHLNDIANDNNDIVFVACALSLGDGNKEVVADVVTE